MNLSDLIPGVSALKLAAIGIALAGAIGFVGYEVHHQREIGRDEIRLEWRAEVSNRRAAALAESQTNARITLRRIERQEENQRVQNAEMARLRAAADRNALDADRVREQAADNARAWGRRLADSPTGADLEAAAAAIAVCTDVRGRLDQAAGILAQHAGAARAAGLKCEKDYDALMPEKSWPSK